MSDICEICGLPKELCTCSEIAKEKQQIHVTLDTKRYRKKVTVIKGIDSKQVDIKKIAKQLKEKFACGGTAKDNKIELQGDFRQKIRGALIELGFDAQSIDVK